MVGEIWPLVWYSLVYHAHVLHLLKRLNQRVLKCLVDYLGIYETVFLCTFLYLAKSQSNCSLSNLLFQGCSLIHSPSSLYTVKNKDKTSFISINFCFIKFLLQKSKTTQTWTITGRSTISLQLNTDLIIVLRNHDVCLNVTWNEWQCTVGHFYILAFEGPVINKIICDPQYYFTCTSVQNANI